MSWLDDVRAVFPSAHEAYATVTVDVDRQAWVSAVSRARDDLGCRDLDFVTAVDRGDDCQVVARVCQVGPGRHGGLVLRAGLGRPPVVDTLSTVYAGAAWHERELHEMFGIDVTGHPGLVPLLLPDGFEGHPLRKDVWLQARQDKRWPGRKEPGESDATVSPGRRRTLPPGVPPEPRSRRGRT